MAHPLPGGRTEGSHTDPHGYINNSDLELAEGVLHTNYVAGFFDAKEHTTFARTNTIAAFWLGRKGLSTCTPPLAHLLRLMVMS